MYSKKLNTCSACTNPHKYCIEEFISSFSAILKLNTDINVYLSDVPPLLAVFASVAER